MRQWMCWIFPRTLVAQLIALTAAAVVLSNFAVAAWFISTRDRMTEAAVVERLLERTVSASTLLSDLPPSQRRPVARAMSGGPWHFILLDRPPVAITMNASESALAERAQRLMADNHQSAPVYIRVLKPAQADQQFHSAEGDSLPPPPRFFRHPLEDVLQISLPVGTGQSLTTLIYRQKDEAWPGALIYALLAAVFTASAAAAFAAQRVARPLSKLTAAATTVARGGDAPRVPEEGPEDIRHAAEAFNKMTDQVGRVMESQRQLLSAVGHDLRTPITSMRIYSEFVAEDDVRERLVKNLDELQALTEAVLSAAKGAGWEKSRRLDLAALIESLCADLEDMGKPVRFESHGPFTLTCRADEIRRAVRNLVENAVAYGKSADVQLKEEADSVAIIVEDNGPGIPADALERVFQPFVRLESSRSSETGGAGLGLTLVKTIAESHGGSITLTNKKSGGLRAILRLPREPQMA